MPRLHVPSNPPLDSPDQCSICHEPLLIPSAESTGPSAIIDDVELRCGHHFHWSCIMQYGLSNAPNARTKCALCRGSVLDRQGMFIVSIRNEGGFTGGFDIGAEMDEEEYMNAHPEVRRKELFLALMSQGDFEDAEVLLKGEDEEGNGEKMDPDAAYDQGGMTAMHMAALNDDVEGIQLLLRYGANKDIRSDSGQTAFDMAVEQDASNVIALLSGSGVAGMPHGSRLATPST